MANENEDIKKGDERTEAPKHNSWLGNLIDKVQDLDTDFPLSGGEEDPRPAHHHTAEKKEDDATGEPKPAEHHESFIHHVIEEVKHKINHLDTDFPLSGGQE